MAKNWLYRLVLIGLLATAVILLDRTEQPIWYDKKAHNVVGITADSRYLWTAEQPGNKVVFKQIDLHRGQCTSQVSVPVPHPNISGFALHPSGQSAGFVIYHSPTSSTACRVDLSTGNVISELDAPGDFVRFSPSLTYVTSSEQPSRNLEQRYVYLHDQKHPLTESYDPGKAHDQITSGCFSDDETKLYMMLNPKDPSRSGSSILRIVHLPDLRAQDHSIDAPGRWNIQSVRGDSLALVGSLKEANQLVMSTFLITLDQLPRLKELKPASIAVRTFPLVQKGSTDTSIQSLRRNWQLQSTNTVVREVSGIDQRDDVLARWYQYLVPTTSHQSLIVDLSTGVASFRTTRRFNQGIVSNDERYFAATRYSRPLPPPFNGKRTFTGVACYDISPKRHVWKMIRMMGGVLILALLGLHLLRQRWIKSQGYVSRSFATGEGGMIESS